MLQWTHAAVQTPAGTPSDRHLIRHGEGSYGGTGKYVLALFSYVLCRFRGPVQEDARTCVFNPAQRKCEALGL